MFSEYLVGETASYSCNSEFELKGKTNLVCQKSGEFDGVPPQCEGIFLLKYFLEYFYLIIFVQFSMTESYKIY